MMLPLLPADPTCTACELHKYAKNPGLPGVLLSSSLPPSPTTPLLVILGMAPSYSDDRHMTGPLKGGAQHLFNTVYLPPLCAAATIVLLQTVRCYTPATTPPKPKQCRTCFSNHSTDDLRAACHHLAPETPRALLCLGAHAIATVTKYTQPKSWSLRTAFTKQGTPSTLWGDYPIFTTFSPGAVMHSPNLIHPVTDHITLVHSALVGTMPVASSPHIVRPFSPTRNHNDQL